MSRLVDRARPKLHLERLEVANRAKRAKEWIEYKKNEDTINKERNFHLYFNGANEQRVREHKRREESETSLTPGIELRKYADIHRRKWGKPETPLMLKQTADNKAFQPSRQSQYERRTGLKFAGSAIMNPDIANRFERLSSGDRQKVLQLIEKCEMQDYNL